MQGYKTYINIFIAAPATPGAPEPIDWSASHCELIWKEPASDGGSPITGYIIEKKDKYSPLWEKAVETSSASPTGSVHGLIEGNEYQFRVIAVNKGGLSEPSEPSKTFTAKPRFCKYFLLLKVFHCRNLTNIFFSLQWLHASIAVIYTTLPYLLVQC